MDSMNRSRKAAIEADRKQLLKPRLTGEIHAGLMELFYSFVGILPDEIRASIDGIENADDAAKARMYRAMEWLHARYQYRSQRDYQENGLAIDHDMQSQIMVTGLRAWHQRQTDAGDG